MATPIGSPRVPSTVGSSLVTPVARDVVEPDESATQPAAPRTLRSVALLTLRCLLRLLRICHAPLSQRLARLTPACLLPILVLCPRCLLFLRPLLLLRTLLLRGDPEGARALFGSGPDDRVPPITDPASFRPARPTSYGPVPGRGGHAPPLAIQALCSHRMVPVQRLAGSWCYAYNAPGPGGDTHAHDDGAGLAMAYARRRCSRS